MGERDGGGARGRSGIRRAGRADAQACGRVLYEAFRALGQPTSARGSYASEAAAAVAVNWMLRSGQFQGEVLEDPGDRITGCVFWQECDGAIGFGPLAVDPSAQGVGVGTRLLQGLCARADAEVLPIYATQAAHNSASLGLYVRMGFDVVGGLSLLERQGTSRPADPRARPMQPEDVPACARLCRQALGFSRERELTLAARGGSGLVLPGPGDELAGYATGFDVPGHAVLRDEGGFDTLLEAAWSEPGALVMVPTQRTGLVRTALERGWRIVQQRTLIARNGAYGVGDAIVLPSTYF